jgi:excinuclease ABC A subunit
MIENKDFIVVNGARENNLKNISLYIPKKRLTVFTGVSGSGKSSLVFDTIAAESQRLINETYDSFIRQRLQKYGKPDVDSIENLPVAIIIDQKTISGNARSTVGTITDIYSLLRLLFSRIGKPFVGHSNAFSFNNLQGMCTKCEGLGKVQTIDLEKLIDKQKSLNEGAIQFPTFEVGGWRWTRYVYSGLFDNDKKIKDYSSEEWYNLVYANNIKLPNKDKRFPKTSPYEGILPRFERTFFRKESKEITEKYADLYARIVKQEICPECNGTRLNQNVLSCKINGKNIAECCNMDIAELLKFLSEIKNPMIQPVLNAICLRLNGLLSIGLGYLTLNRETSSLSGGEAQRIKLIKHLSSGLTDLIYIFDEPSVGLHPSDVCKMNNLLLKLRDKGNTILVVEHDLDVIRIADHIVELGVSAGKKGGSIIYEGDFQGLKQSDTPTGKYVRLKKQLKISPRTSKQYISITNAKLHNLKCISVDIPLSMMTVITGVAGSGKSSLMKVLHQQHPEIVIIDQHHLKGSKRSNVATYTGIMDLIRDLFAKTNHVKSALFSNNSKGACPECKGLGIISTDLAFMDTVEVECDACNGSGYNQKALKYKFKERSIKDIMCMTVNESLLFFHELEIVSVLKKLQKVGLGYVTLGQSLNTFSGGECQRLKLATELKTKGKVYIFDEPTTGLHGLDIQRLLSVFNQLIDTENSTVIIIEHNLDIISQADWVIEIGPNAGKEGGNLIFSGLVRDILKCSTSVTGSFLKKYIK